jgi:hypothetical protein
MPLLRNDAPIVPDWGLGGLTLRTRMLDVQDLFYGLGLYSKGSYRLVTPFEARYRLEEHRIEIAIDVRNGKIFKLMAIEGYSGLLFGGVAVGMLVREATDLVPDLYYSEADEGILCRGVAGLFIDISETDPPPELVPSLSITSISVEVRELETGAAERGEW